MLLGSCLRVSLTVGLSGVSWRQIRVVRALSLTRLGDVSFFSDTPSVRGMLRKVSHLLSVDLFSPSSEGEPSSLDSVPDYVFI